MRIIVTLALTLAANLNLRVSTCFAQGSLTPPGAPSATMKTLAQIEPRTPIAVLPFAINAPGSYYLTTNLTGVATQHGITISASGVTIDLMGFELAGVSNSLDGINVSGAQTNIVVRNGTVRGWGGDGVNAFSANNSQLERLAASSNGDAGMVTGFGSTISACNAYANATNGIYAGSGCTVTGCTASANNDDGIVTLHGATVSGCTTRNNGGDGISAGLGNVVNSCTTSSNLVDGIFAAAGSTVSGCSAYFNAGDGIFAGQGSTVNGCTSAFNIGDGIDVTSDCRVLNSNCDSNGNIVGDGAGIHVTGSDNRIEGNNVTDNARGLDIDFAGNLIIRNSASGNTSNYEIVANNKVGTIVLAPNSGAISGDTGGAGVGSTDPWANFSY